jgi:hypothetical protein
MTIDFTNEEYATLVEMILVADWIIHANEVEQADVTSPYADLRKKVLSHHKEMGMEDAFEYSSEDDEYYETADYEENSRHMAFIDEYEEHGFWEMLASKLAQRDFAAQEVESETESLNREQRELKLWEIQEYYEDEFAENGLDNILLKAMAGDH